MIGMVYTTKEVNSQIRTMPFAQKSKYRITLEIEALDDFNPHQINWEKLFQLDGNESVECYIEDLSSKYDHLW